jgi:hypothetical protein
MKFRIPKWTLYLFKIALTLGILVVILYGFQKKLGEQENLLDRITRDFRSMKPLWLLGAFFFYFLASLAGTMRVWLLSRAHAIRIPYRTLLKNMYIGYLFNPLLMGATGGDIVRSYYLARQTGKKTEIVTVVFLDRFVGVIVLGTLSISVLLANMNDPMLQAVLWPMMGVYVFLILFALISSSRRIIAKFSFLNRFFGQSRARQIALKSFETLNATKRFKKTLLLTALCTLLSQSLVIVSGWLASRSIATLPFVSLKYFFLFLPIIFTVSAVPVSLGGLGVGEAAYAALFPLIGLSESGAITLALLQRLILIAAAAAGAVIYLLPSTQKVDIEDALNEDMASL